MAWFTSAASAPDVATNKDVVTQRYSIVGATTKTYTRRQTTAQREKRGMAITAADSAITALAADTSVSDISRQPIGGGGYNVRYTQTTATAWAEV